MTDREIRKGASPEDAAIARDYERRRAYPFGPAWRLANARMLDRLTDGWLFYGGCSYRLDCLGEVERRRSSFRVPALERKGAACSS